MIRPVVVLVAWLLTVGCTSSSTQTDGSNAASPTLVPTASSPSASGADSCDLLSADQVADLAGMPAGEPQPTLVAGLPACRWTINDRRFVQVGSLPAPDWAQAVPQLLRVMKDAGADEDEVLFQEISDRFDAAGALTPTEACDAFSAILELQGQPEGTQLAATIAPSREDPLALSGQMCTVGRFTTVTLGDGGGLTKPVPSRQVLRALKLAHRKALG